MTEREITIYVEIPVTITVHDYHAEAGTHDCPGSPAEWELANICTPTIPTSTHGREKWLGEVSPNWEEEVDNEVESARIDEAEYNMELQAERIIENQKIRG